MATAKMKAKREIIHAEIISPSRGCCQTVSEKERTAVMTYFFSTIVVHWEWSAQSCHIIKLFWIEGQVEKCRNRSTETKEWKGIMEVRRRADYQCLVHAYYWIKTVCWGLVGKGWLSPRIVSQTLIVLSDCMQRSLIAIMMPQWGFSKPTQD